MRLIDYTVSSSLKSSSSDYRFPILKKLYEEHDQNAFSLVEKWRKGLQLRDLGQRHVANMIESRLLRGPRKHWHHSPSFLPIIRVLASPNNKISHRHHPRSFESSHTTSELVSLQSLAEAMAWLYYCALSPQSGQSSGSLSSIVRWGSLLTMLALDYPMSSNST